MHRGSKKGFIYILVIFFLNQCHALPLNIGYIEVVLFGSLKKKCQLLGSKTTNPFLIFPGNPQQLTWIAKSVAATWYENTL